MLTAAWILLIIGALEVIARPFLIGKQQEAPTAFGWLVTLFLFVVLYLPVCGRVIGWW